MRRADVIFIAVAGVALAVGVALGWNLASRAKLETFKVLNITGQTYSLLGFVVLSELLAKSDRWKRFVVRWMAGILLWGQTIVPLGALAGAWLNTGAPSSANAASFFGAVFAYSILPLALLDATVFYPRLQNFQELSGRVHRFGFLLLLSGALVQLLAAWLDFNG